VAGAPFGQGTDPAAGRDGNGGAVGPSAQAREEVSALQRELWADAGAHRTGQEGFEEGAVCGAGQEGVGGVDGFHKRLKTAGLV